MIFSFLASAVTMRTGTSFNPMSDRIARKSSMPVICGIFQSEITRSAFFRRSSSSASLPFSASRMFFRLSSRSSPRTMRRMVDASSTTRMSIFGSITVSPPPELRLLDIVQQLVDQRLVETDVVSHVLDFFADAIAPVDFFQSLARKPDFELDQKLDDSLLHGFERLLNAFGA